MCIRDSIYGKRKVSAESYTSAGNDFGPVSYTHLLGWRLDDSRSGALQRAYRVVVGRDSAAVAAGRGDVWDSGRTDSDGMLVRYAGLQLDPFTRYYWAVTVWDKDYARSSSGVAAFESGMMEMCIRDRNPRCEMQVNPVGLSAVAPHLSWELISGERGVEQRFYRILVASSEENLDANRGDKWDSGWVRSDESVYIPYGGAPLRSRETCFWKVRVKTGKGCSAWSQPAAWTMGFMDASAWEARWIGLDRCFEGERTEGHTRLAARYFRKEFDAPGEVRRAVLYISGLGLYEAYINGKRIGTQVLAQAPTDYDKSVFYNVFDVTEAICPGENALGVVLGNGRYVSPRNPGMRHFGFPKMFLQLELEYADGTCRKVVSDDSWRATAAGPIRANNEFDGEEYDARMEMLGWNEPGYADEAWLQAETVAAPGGKLTVQTNPMIEIMGTVRPVAIAPVSYTHLGVYKRQPPR